MSDTPESPSQFRLRMPGQPEDTGDASEWSKFVKLTQQIVSVPKEEIEQERTAGA